VQVNIHEAKTKLSSLLARVAAGEDVVIASAGKPVARLGRYEQSGHKRVAGRYAGQGNVARDFNAPLSDFEDAFYDR
jgi:prevent-host-death family protein